MKKIIEFLKKLINKIGIRTAIEILIGALLLVLLGIYMNSYRKTKDKYLEAKNNEKSLINQLNSSASSVIEYEGTIADLEYMNDSVSKKLVEAKDAMNIKDKNIKQLQYMLSRLNKRDTVTLSDTVFKDPTLCMDTTIGNEWVSTELHMHYPSTIEIDTKAKSEKIVAIYTSREPVDAPKKCFIGRWFQKKQTITKVEIQENNPYIVSDKNVFYKISD